MSQSANVFTKDLYKVLNVKKTATMQEIKVAYRKMAMSFHPDRHNGDAGKADAFKSASEAYNILGDHKKRTEYDRVSHGYSKKQYEPRPSPNYRKVYAPRPPPGFKVFDNQRHFDMHYGDGQMQMEITRVQKRVLEVGFQSVYQSPLGPGFSFEHLEKTGDGNPYVKGSQGTKVNGGGGKTRPSQSLSFAGEFAGRPGGIENATRYYHKVQVREKMEERRQSRPTREEREKLKGKNGGVCTVS